MDLASEDESEDDRDRTPPYGRQSQEDEEVEEEVVVVAEEEDETEEEDATEEQDPPPTAPSVPDDLNELLGNIAAQLTVEFEETVDTWHPAGKVTLPQLTLTACPRPGYWPSLTLTTLLGLTLTGLVGSGCDASLRDAPCLVPRRPATARIRGSAEGATAAGLRGQRLRVRVPADQPRAGARAAR